MDHEIFMKGKEVIMKELDNLFMKGSLTPTETEAAMKGMCLLEKIDEYIDGSGEYSEGRRMSRDWRPEHHMEGRIPYREYEITSYGDRTRGGMRYSGHSINDRVVEKLENLMDTAESDYEKKKIKEFIRFVRDDEMNG